MINWFLYIIAAVCLLIVILNCCLPSGTLSKSIKNSLGIESNKKAIKDLDQVLVKINRNSVIQKEFHSLSKEKIDQIKELFYSLREKEQQEGVEGIKDRSNRGGWHSNNDIISHFPVQHLFLQLEPYLTRYAQNLGLNKSDLVIQAWTIINNQGNFNISHCHVDTLFCGCYYLDMDLPTEGNGDVQFLETIMPEDSQFKKGNWGSYLYDPNLDKKDDGVIQSYNQETGMVEIQNYVTKKNVKVPYFQVREFKAKMKHTPSPGDLLIFANDQYHQVFPYNGKKDRIIIAFNVYYYKNGLIHKFDKPSPLSSEEELGWFIAPYHDPNLMKFNRRFSEMRKLE